MKLIIHSIVVVSALFVGVVFTSCTKCEDNPTRLEPLTFRGMSALQDILPIEVSDTIQFVTNTGRVTEFVHSSEGSGISLIKNMRINKSMCDVFMGGSLETSKYILDAETFRKKYSTKDSQYSAWSLEVRCFPGQEIIDVSRTSSFINMDTLVLPILFTNNFRLLSDELPYFTCSILYFNDMPVPSSYRFVYMNGAKINIVQHGVVDSNYTLRELKNNVVQMQNQSTARYNSISTINISGRNLTDCYMIEEMSPSKPEDMPKSVVISQRYGIVRIEWTDGRTLTREWK
jgi:hypothetical protein